MSATTEPIKDSNSTSIELPATISVSSPSSLTNSIDVTDHQQQNYNNGIVSQIVPGTSSTTTTYNKNNNDNNDNVKIKNPLMDDSMIDQNSNTQKSNWVKFDDDDDDDGGTSDGNNSNNNKVNNNNNNINNNTNHSKSSTIINNNSNNNTNRTTSAIEQTKTGITSIPGPPIQKNKLSSKVQSNEITPAPAVLSHINLNSVTTSPHSTVTSGVSPIKRTDTPKNVVKANNAPVPTNSNVGAPMRTIELSTGRIREGFANGDVIVTLLPTNTRWPWITPAIFRPELVPEELMAQGLTLTVEEYVNAMETLVNDYRFTVYNICYKRVLVCWIVFAFCVLLTLLFSGLKGIALFSLGVGWLFLNAAAIFFCMWIKLRLSRGLEKCLARVNKQLIRHKILLVLDDRGRISCHKVNLCFLYFDPAQCIAYLNQFIERSEQNGANIQSGWEAKLDVDIRDIVIQGNNPVRVSRKQAIAQEIFLSYLQRWGKDFLRRRLDWTVNEAGVHETPRHLMSSICPCQYEEEILNNKIRTQSKKSCCTEFFHNPCGGNLC